MSIPPCKAHSAGTFTSHFTVYLDDETAGQVRAYAARSRQKLAVTLRDLIEFGLDDVSRSHSDAGRASTRAVLTAQEVNKNNTPPPSPDGEG